MTSWSDAAPVDDDGGDDGAAESFRGRENGDTRNEDNDTSGSLSWARRESRPTPKRRAAPLSSGVVVAPAYGSAFLAAVNGLRALRQISAHADR